MQEYLEQIKRMIKHDQTCLYVDFHHLQSFDDYLAKAVSEEFVR